MQDALAKIIPGTWIFRLKRDPSGTIRKFKARYCVRGDLEEDNGEDNLASVVAWSTVRLFLVLCFLLDLTTASIDFTMHLSNPFLIHPSGSTFLEDLCPLEAQAHVYVFLEVVYGLRRSP